MTATRLRRRTVKTLAKMVAPGLNVSTEYCHHNRRAEPVGTLLLKAHGQDVRDIEREQSYPVYQTRLDFMV